MWEAETENSQKLSGQQAYHIQWKTREYTSNKVEGDWHLRLSTDPHMHAGKYIGLHPWTHEHRHIAYTSYTQTHTENTNAWLHLTHKSFFFLPDHDPILHTIANLPLLYYFKKYMEDSPATTMATTQSQETMPLHLKLHDKTITAG